jgi:hypothetical protein
MQWRGKHTSVTTEELLGNGVFCWGLLEAIQRGELRESLEMAVEDDGEAKT